MLEMRHLSLTCLRKETGTGRRYLLDCRPLSLMQRLLSPSRGITPDNRSLAGDRSTSCLVGIWLQLPVLSWAARSQMRYVFSWSQQFSATTQPSSAPSVGVFVGIGIDSRVRAVGLTEWPGSLTHFGSSPAGHCSDVIEAVCGVRRTKPFATF